MPVMQCTCTHEFQDEMYGHKMRVFNRRPEGKKRCTVCTKEVGETVKKKEPAPEAVKKKAK